MTEKLTNKDLQRIIESRTSSGYVSMLNPLEIYMRRELLDEVTRQSMESIRDSRKASETKTERDAAERALQQRIDFLSWLDTQPEDVYMAVYPADMDGLDDLEDLQDLLDNDTGRLPF
jgi:hypothetical protein